MGNQASTHSPELIDTSVEDWYGSGSRRSTTTTNINTQFNDADDWAPQDPRTPKTPTAMRSPKTPRSSSSSTSMYDEDVRDPEATKPSSIFRPNLEPLVEATAAVFHMRSMDQQQQKQYDENADWSLPARGADPEDDISISDRSAAVFSHLEVQARKGNHQPFVKLLETATVVSQLLMGSQSEEEEEERDPAPPVSSASSSDSEDSDDDSSDDDSSIEEEEEEQRPRRRKPAPQGGLFDRLGGNDIIDVEGMNAGAVFDLLDKVKSVESTDVKEFSSAVFGMLEDAKSFSLQTPDERKVNIFRMLEDNNLRDLAEAVLGKDSDPETRDDAPHQERDMNAAAAMDTREDYPEVPKDTDEKRETPEDGVSVLETPEVETTDGKRSVQIKNMEGDPIDLTFVQDFDEAFNEFMGQNPKFLLKSPELVHNMRIAKLQQLLAYMNAKEKSVVAEYNQMEETKKKMEDEYHLKLRETARAKAARQIYFKSELEKVSHVSNTLEAKFKWAVVASAESRTKKHHQMRQDFASEKPDETREQLLERLPKDVPGQGVMAVIRDDGIPSTMSAAEKGTEIRKLQMNIAFLTSEVKMWQSKLDVVEADKKKVAWVETILQQLSKKQMARLQGRHQRKTGIQVE